MEVLVIIYGGVFMEKVMINPQVCSFSTEQAKLKAKNITKDMADILICNGLKVDKKDINHIYKNIYYALIP